MSVLVDTNVLLRRIQPDHVHHALAIDSVARLIASGELVCFTLQNILERDEAADRRQRVASSCEAIQGNEKELDCFVARAPRNDGERLVHEPSTSLRASGSSQSAWKGRAAAERVHPSGRTGMRLGIGDESINRAIGEPRLKPESALPARAPRCVTRQPP
jgi:hypothetical protein